MSLLKAIQSVKASYKHLDIEGIDEQVPVCSINRLQFQELIDTVTPLLDKAANLYEFQTTFLVEKEVDGELVKEVDMDAVSEQLYQLLMKVPDTAIEIAMFFMSWDKDDEEQRTAMDNLPLGMVVAIAVGGLSYNIELSKSGFEFMGNVLPFLRKQQETPQAQATAQTSQKAS